MDRDRELYGAIDPTSMRTAMVAAKARFTHQRQLFETLFFATSFSNFNSSQVGA